MKLPRGPSPKSAAEEELTLHLRHAAGLPLEREFRFHPERKWRADFAVWPRQDWQGKPLLVEIEGAIRGKPGRHQRVDGMAEDCEKYAEAMCLGYTILRVMPSQVRSGQALSWIERLVSNLPEE